MCNSIEQARKNVESIRFSADTMKPHSSRDSSRSEQIKDAFYKSGLLITEQTTPELASQFRKVCENLKLPHQCTEAFVYASHEIQAGCFTSSTDECVIRFSSTLINLLDGEEFSFVAGHELGHFLLGHGLVHYGSSQESLESLMQQRTQEISADRVGLVACGDIKIAIRALMKIVSGLEHRHLRFDVGQFISQLSKVSKDGYGGEIRNTHPSIIIRCRSLLWFAMGGNHENYPESIEKEAVKKLDDKIFNDFNKYVDGPARASIESAKNNLAMWIAVLEIIKDGRFDKKEQEKFQSMFGKDLLNKMINFISELSKGEVNDAVLEKMEVSREELESLIPGSFDEVHKRITKEICAHYQ